MRANDGAVYRFAGGAPFWVSTWSAFGGAQPYIDIDSADINHAGGDFPWHAVKDRAVDAVETYDQDGRFVSNFDGTLFVTAAQTGRVYKMISGAPVYVTTWSAYPGPKSIVVLDQIVFDQAGGVGRTRFMGKAVADNWAIRGAQTGQVYLMAGGAPIYLTDPGMLNSDEGQIIPATVDQNTIDRSGQATPYNTLLKTPRDGTYLLAFGPNGVRTYRTTGGAPIEVDGIPPTAPYAVIDQIAVDNAGRGGIWDHLAPPPAPTTTSTTTTSTTSATTTSTTTSTPAATATSTG